MEDMLVVFWYDKSVEIRKEEALSKIKKSLVKFFKYFGISFLQFEGTTVILYPAEFKQRAKNEYHNPMLWLALDNTDHVFVGTYLRNNCREEHLNTPWVIEMHRQKRYREVREMAEAVLCRCIRRRALYNEWYTLVNGEVRVSAYQRFTQGVPGDSIREKFW